MQPTNDDVQQVSNFMDGQQPQAQQPVQQQPQQDTQQPQPEPQQPLPNDFGPGIKTADRTVQEPQQPQQPQQERQQANPSEMFNADPKTGTTPQRDMAPQQQVQQPQETETYDQYVDRILKTLPQDEAPKFEKPDLSKYDTNKAEDVDKFFEDFAKSVQDATLGTLTAQQNRQRQIEQIEHQAWREAMNKHKILETNQEVRDIVHNYRVGSHSRGRYLSPTQAADEILGTINQRYQQGVADSQVQTTIEQSQPQGGGTQQPAQASEGFSQQEIMSVQEGGEQALMQILANKINNAQL